jgi:hypothetical protein
VHRLGQVRPCSACSMSIGCLALAAARLAAARRLIAWLLRD